MEIKDYKIHSTGTVILHPKEIKLTNKSVVLIEEVLPVGPWYFDGKVFHWMGEYQCGYLGKELIESLGNFKIKEHNNGNQ